MEPDRIKKLLDKYWQAETTEQEEAELQEYFTSTQSRGNHPADALFNYFKEERQVTMPTGAGEKFDTGGGTQHRRIVWLRPLLKIAAVLLIVFSIVYLLIPASKPTPLAAKEDTYKDPRQAYLETKKALMLISRHLSTGESYMSEIEKINKAEQLINKND